MHKPTRNRITATRSVNNSFLMLGKIFNSINGPMAASRVPNSLSIPRRINIRKKRMAQSGDTSISRMASENVMNARPGPDPTCW